jgi:hypothetical protein
MVATIGLAINRYSVQTCPKYSDRETLDGCLMDLRSRPVHLIFF